MSDIFQEVDEDVRKDKALSLWSRYGRLLIGSVIGVILTTAGWQLWSSLQLNQRQADAEQFLIGVGLMSANQHGDAVAIFKQISENSGKGYTALAMLQRAAALISAGDRIEGVKAYDLFSDDVSQDKELRDLARLLAAKNLVDTADLETLNRRLSPLLEGNSPWRFSALELSGLAAIRSNDKALAKDLFTQLIDDLDTPQGIRIRSAELLAAIGSED